MCSIAWLFTARRTRLRALHLPIVTAAAGLLIATAGCSQPSAGSLAPATAAADQSSPSVTIVKPERTTLRWSTRAPGYIQAYEQTPVFAKIAGYVRKWHVDISDSVNPGDVLAELYVPEMEEELRLKKEMVEQARKTHEAARASYETAKAQVEVEKAGGPRAAALVKRWQIESEYLKGLVGKTVDKQTLDVATYQLEAAQAALKEVEAKIKSAEATRDEMAAKRDKAKVDISVAEADRDRVAALLSYTKLRAPSWKAEREEKAVKGVVTRRNVNTDDFVQPPTAGKSEPLYVIERRDIMRIFVPVREEDAAWVNKGAQARIRVQALQEREFTGEVARTSYALDRTSHTLLVEIDLPNPQDLLRPNMYAYGTITAERRDVRALPTSAVVTQGDVNQGYQNYCFMVEGGKARRTFLQVGTRTEKLVEVIRKQVPGEQGAWQDFDGREQVIANAANVSEGQQVKLAAAATP